MLNLGVKHFRFSMPEVEFGVLPRFWPLQAVWQLEERRQLAKITFRSHLKCLLTTALLVRRCSWGYTLRLKPWICGWSFALQNPMAVIQQMAYGIQVTGESENSLSDRTRRDAKTQQKLGKAAECPSKKAPTVPLHLSCCWGNRQIPFLKPTNECNRAYLCQKVLWRLSCPNRNGQEALRRSNFWILLTDLVVKCATSKQQKQIPAPVPKSICSGSQKASRFRQIWLHARDSGSTVLILFREMGRKLNGPKFQ